MPGVESQNCRCPSGERIDAELKEAANGQDIADVTLVPQEVTR